MEQERKFIQVGFTAMRNPATGEFLPAVPLYIEATPEVEASESTMIENIAGIFAEKFKQYHTATKAAAL